MTAGPGLIHAAHHHGAVMAVLRRQLGSGDLERGLSAPRAQARILTAISELPDAQITTGDRLSSVVAVIRGAHPGGVALLRADTDAVTATTPGVHAAALAGAAWILAGLRDRLSGDVVCVWQPGAAGHGGGRALLADGILRAAGRPVDAVYAVRAIPGMPRGTVAVRSGPVLTAVDRLRVTLAGGPGGGSRPVAVACHLATALDRIHAGDVGVTVDQVLSDRDGDAATVAVTVHTRHPAGRTRAHEAVARLAGGYATAHGLHAAVRPDAATVAAHADPAEAARVARVVADLYGRDRLVELAAPIAAPDDVGDLLAAVPGALALLLGALPGDGEDTTLLPTAAALYAGMAVARLTDRRVTPATIRRRIHHPGGTTDVPAPAALP
jgi:hippurate hydrolase